MKKRMTFLVIVTLMISLTGCQKTPESPIVVGKDYEEMINQALLGQPTEDSIAVQIEASDKYTLDAPLKNAVGNVEVYVDADVVVPDSSKMTTVKVSRHSFSVEECAKYIQVLFNGQKTYSGQVSVSKPKLLKRIEQAQMELQEAIAQEDEKMIFLWQETLDKYQRELESYGEGEGLVEAQVAFSVNKDNYNEEKMYLVSDGSDGLYRSIVIRNHDEFRTYELIYNVSKDDYPEISEVYNMTMTSELNFGTEMLGDPNALPDLIKSEEDAISDATQMLSDLGIHDFSAKDIDMVFGDINGKIQKAYSISFTRTINGVSFNYNSIGLSSGDAVDDGKGGKTPIWGTESISFIVTDDGVVQFEMSNLLEVHEVVTEYTKMKDFEDIMDIFKKMILIVHANVPEGELRKMEIDRMELGLMRILEPNTLDSGVVVPVWDFYGRLQGEEYEDHDKIYLTINAIDGSIVDRRLGY